MSDQSFHEIQLSGKQLIFLFMCAVVLTVVVFLFGVSVGREVRSPAAQVASTRASAPTDMAVPADAPPPTQTAPNELSYAQALPGRDGEDPSKASPPTPASEEAPAAAPPEKSAPPATPVAAKKTDAAAALPPSAGKEGAPSSTSAGKKAAPPSASAGKDTQPAVAAPPVSAAKAPALPPAAKSVPPLNGFFVQVEAFSANDIASKEVTKLRGKGYPAFVFNEPENTPGPRYKVRVGPYSARAEADQTLKNLTKEGYKPLIKR